MYASLETFACKFITYWNEFCCCSTWASPASCPVILSDFECDITCQASCWWAQGGLEPSALSCLIPIPLLLTWIARTGLGMRLGLHFSHDRGTVYENYLSNRKRFFVSGMHNCQVFSQPLKCLYPAMQTCQEIDN